MGVYRRKDTGVWEVRFQIKGVKFYRSVPEARNKPQAKDAEAAMRREVYEGRYGRDGREIGARDFTEFCEAVYLPDARGRLRQFKNEEYKVKALCRYFKGKRLKDITLIAIQKYRRERLTGDSKQGRPRQASTVKGEISTLSSVLDMAIECDQLGLNPCRKLKWGRGQTKSERDRVLSPDEEDRLMPQLERFTETKAAVVLSLNTGLRRMGLLQRKVSDVNLKARKLRYIAKGGAVKFAPLNDTALAVIEDLISHAGPDGYLFHVRTGHNLSAGEGAFQLAVRRAQIVDLHFHDLRHTFSTRVRAFTDAFTVRDLMGHTKVETTNLYVESDFELMRAAVESLGKKGNVVQASFG